MTMAGALAVPGHRRQGATQAPPKSPLVEGYRIIQQKATAWYSSRDITSPTQQSLPNRVNPAADPAQFGSTTGEDTNSPERIPYDIGKPFLHSYGDADSGNRIEMDGDHRVDPTENYLRLSAHLRDYPDNATVYDQCSAIGAASGRLQLGVSKNGQIMASARTVSVSSQIGYSDPIPGWEPGMWVFIRGVWDGTGWSFFYKFNEADAWSTVDADQAASADSLNSNLGSANIQFGHQNVAGTRPTVDVAWAEVHQEAGTVEFNPSRDWNGESSTFVDATSGGTITITEGSDNIPFLVTVPNIVFDGTDDRIQLPIGASTPNITATTGQHTRAFLLRCDALQGNDRLFELGSSADTAVGLFVDAGHFYMRVEGDMATANKSTTGEFTPGEWIVGFAEYDEGLANVWTSSHGYVTGYLDYTGVGTLVAFEKDFIGATVNGTGAAAFELAEVLDLPTILADSEKQAVSAYLLAGLS